MRELMPENAEWKRKVRPEASCIIWRDKKLVCLGQRFPVRREGWKCKDRASLRESRV